MAEFLGNNNLGSRDMLLHRSVYRSYVLALLQNVTGPTIETLQIKDFLKDEKILIGRVDERYNPIYPLEDFIRPLAFGAGAENVSALNFVASAFEEMKQKFDRDLNSGNISGKSPILSELSAKTAYTSASSQYSNYVNSLQDDFLQFTKKRNRIKKIKDFDSFLPIFMDYVRLRCKTSPITRSMYLMTRFVHPRTSGLVLEVHNGDYGDDRSKVDLFYRQHNFEYFKNLAYSFGFVIDKNVPWRLVADINSPQMKRFISPLYGATATATTVLFSAFQKTYPDDIPTLIDTLVKFYNTVADFRKRTVIVEPTATESSSETFARCRTINVITRDPVTLAGIESSYTSSKWLEMYAEIRNVETSMLYNEAVLRNIISNAIYLNNSVDESTGLGYIISKFDNVEHFEGSLFYDITRINLSRTPDATEADVAEIVRRSVQASNFVVY